MVYVTQIIGGIFILLIIYITYLSYKKKEIPERGFAFWTAVWVIAFLLVLFHEKVNKILPSLQIIRTLDLYMIVGFMFLFLIMFYLYKKSKIFEKKIEILARNQALSELKN